MMRGERVIAEVERQLLEAAHHYGITGDDLSIDWSKAVGEGHSLYFWDGWIENQSDVGVTDSHGAAIAGGWIEFVVFPEETLHVYWDSFWVMREGKWRDISRSGLPLYVWQRLPDAAKDQYAFSRNHQAEPHVLVWLESREKPGGV
jgi:hypothetical protein